MQIKKFKSNSEKNEESTNNNTNKKNHIPKKLYAIN